MPSYWLIIDGKNFKTGENIQSRRFGPYASEQEAERAELEFWLVIDGETFETTEHIQSRRFGPNTAEQEREQTDLELFPEEGRDYVYRVHIEAETDTR